MIRALHVLFVRATYARGLRRAPSIMVNHMVKRTVLPTPPLALRWPLARICSVSGARAVTAASVASRWRQRCP